MTKQEVPKGLQTKDMVKFSKLIARITQLEKMLRGKMMQEMPKIRRLGDMLEGVTEKKRKMLGMSPPPKQELPGQEERATVPPQQTGFEGGEGEYGKGMRGGAV